MAVILVYGAVERYICMAEKVNGMYDLTNPSIELEIDRTGGIQRLHDDCRSNLISNYG